MSGRRIRIGSRGSPLALAQTELVRARIAASSPAFAGQGALEIVVIRTTGDKVLDRPLADIGGKGLFSKEIDEAMLAGAIDLAVHSVKDLPTWLPAGLTLGAVLAREDPRDVLIAPVARIADLPRGAIVGTSSPRRQAQVLAHRPDLRVVPLRGNVHTRLRKLAMGEVTATLLALAGLRRLGMDGTGAVLNPDEMLPAVGQGAIGVTCREDDSEMRTLAAALSDDAAIIEVTAERAMLAALDGSCRTPIGGLARAERTGLHLRGLVARPDGGRVFAAERRGAWSDAEAMGADLGGELRRRAGPDFFYDASHAMTGRLMRVWITRPAEDAARLAEALRAQGIEVLIEPLLRIVFSDGPPLDPAGAQALLATSANGVRAFARRSQRRDVPVLLVVGDASARAAREEGYGRVESASGDVVALAELVRRRLDPKRGPLLHIAGTEVAGDLAGALAEAGFEYRREILYAARAAQGLSEALVAHIRRGAVDAVLVFSPRTGKTLVRLMQAAELEAAAPRLICFCLSQAVAVAVSSLRWREVVVARQPTQAAMIDDVIAAHASLSSVGTPNSPSANSAFAATLGQRSISRRSRDGGMSSDTEKDQLAANATPARTAEPAGPADATPVAIAESALPPEPESSQSSVDVAATQPSTEPATAEALMAEPPPAEAPAAEPAARPWTRDTASEEAARAGAASASRADDIAAAPAAPAPRRGSRVLWWVLGALALLAAAGALTYRDYIEPRLRQFVQAPSPVDDQGEINAAFEDLEARQVRLRQQLEALAPRVDAIERTLSALRASVDKLSSSQPSVEVEVVKQLGDRVALLESQAGAASGMAQQLRSLEASTAFARDTASKLATTVLAVGQLVQAVGDGGDFVRQLASVRALGGDDPDIAQAAAELEPFAATGAPTLAALRAEFPSTASAVVRAAPVSAGEGWTDRVMDQLASLVVVRRLGSEAIAAGGVDGIVAQAETALEGGDLQAAVTTLERLDGAPAEAATEWLRRARARLTADRALAALQERALARLSTGKG